MYERRPLGVLAAGHTGDYRHDAGTDIGTHRYVYALVKADEAAHKHRKGDGCHHGRTLDYRGEYGSDEHQQHRIADSCKESLDARKRCEFLHRAAHEGETDEEHTETCKYASQGLVALLIGKERDESSNSGECREYDAGRDPVASEHTERNNLRGDGRTYIRTVDDGRRLCQGYDAGIHKTDGHHGCRTGTLDGSGTDSTYADAEQFAPGCLGEQMLQSFRTCRLEIGTHYLTGNQKDSDTCQECEDCSKRCSSAHISINLGPNLTKK